MNEWRFNYLKIGLLCFAVKNNSSLFSTKWSLQNIRFDFQVLIVNFFLNSGKATTTNFNTNRTRTT
jgi:hypothetical protein